MLSRVSNDFHGWPQCVQTDGNVWRHSPKCSSSRSASDGNGSNGRYSAHQEYVCIRILESLNPPLFVESRTYHWQECLAKLGKAVSNSILVWIEGLSRVPAYFLEGFVHIVAEFAERVSYSILFWIQCSSDRAIG